MAEESAGPQLFDVTVNFGDGIEIKLGEGLSRTAALMLKKRTSQFFLGVQVVERGKMSQPPNQNLS